MRTFLSFLATILCVSVAGQSVFYTGGDLSYVPAVEAGGGQYTDSESNSADVVELFAEGGANMIRLRLWHTPQNVTSHCGSPITNSSLEEVLALAQRVKAADMELLLCMHFSDYFVDPNKQPRPAAWEGLSLPTVVDSIYAYTQMVMSRLHAQNTLPDMIAIGNETDSGFVDATLNTNGINWLEDAPKFNAGLQAVDDFNAQHDTQVKTMIHITEKVLDWLPAQLEANGVTNFDVLGVSYYPKWSPTVDLESLGASIQAHQQNFPQDLMVVETGFVWTTDWGDNYGNFMGDNGQVVDYPTTPQGQHDFLFDLCETVASSSGQGVIYWEPAWIPSQMCDQWGQGSSYENASLFDFNAGNSALPGMDFLGYDPPVSTVSSVSDSDLRVLPNPLQGRTLTISSSLSLVQATLYDYHGRAIHTYSLSRQQAEYSLDLPQLAPSVYLLRLRDENDRKVIRKLVVVE